jgi:hypothetical protein
VPTNGCDFSNDPAICLAYISLYLTKKCFFSITDFFSIFSLQKTVEALGVGVENRHTSPFRSVYWVIFVQLWAATCLVFVTWNHLASL